MGHLWYGAHTELAARDTEVNRPDMVSVLIIIAIDQIIRILKNA